MLIFYGFSSSFFNACITCFVLNSLLFQNWDLTVCNCVFFSSVTYHHEHVFRNNHNFDHENCTLLSSIQPITSRVRPNVYKRGVIIYPGGNEGVVESSSFHSLDLRFLSHLWPHALSKQVKTFEWKMKGLRQLQNIIPNHLGIAKFRGRHEISFWKRITGGKAQRNVCSKN